MLSRTAPADASSMQEPFLPLRLDLRHRNTSSVDQMCLANYGHARVLLDDCDRVVVAKFVEVADVIAR